MEPGPVDDCRACQQQQQQLQGPEAARRESPPPPPVPESPDDEATEPSSSGGLADVPHDPDLDDEEKAGPAGFNRSFLRCLVLLLPVSVPVVVYVRDADSTRRLFLFAFALFLVLIFSCIALAVVRSRSRGAGSDDDEEAAPRAGRSSSSRGLPFLRAMPYRVAQVRSGPHRNRYPGYRLAGQQLSPGARCPVVQDDPPCYLDALKCPLAQTHQHKSRDVETPPPAYEAVS